MKITHELTRFGLKPGLVQTVTLTIWSDRPDTLGISPKGGPPVLLRLQPGGKLFLEYHDCDGFKYSGELPVLEGLPTELDRAVELLQAAEDYIERAENEAGEVAEGWKDFYERMGLNKEIVEGPTEMPDPLLSADVRSFLAKYKEKPNGQ